MPIPLIPGLAELADRYEGFILDVWGVMHQGGAAYPEALACVRRLRAAGKRVVFLSNAPRRAERVAAVLQDKGVSPGDYDAVLSSGEATRRAFAARAEAPAANLGRRYVLFGPHADDDLLDGLGYERTDRLADADFMLAIGFQRDRGTVEAHDPMLREAQACALPMVCVNPDKLVIRLGKAELCAGAIAARYAALGGTVHYFGKPYPAVYALCHEALGLAPREILAVGDGLETDIRGANRASLDSLLVTSGLLADALGHDFGAKPDPAALEDACQEVDVSPQFATPTFAW